MLHPPRFALVRAVSPGFAGAITRHSQPPDPARAAAQHRAYVGALRAAGLQLIELEADSELPDCCFVEDMALLVGGRALLSCPGAPARRPERAAVEAALPLPKLRAEELAPGATLDGGDCLRVGQRLFVGRSDRTNGAGVEAVKRAFPELSVVAVPAVDLHLKSSCTALGDDTVLIAQDSVDPTFFAGLRLVVVPREEAAAANAVWLGERVLVAAGHPRTAALVAGLGYEVVLIEADEIRKADGALTCMSLLW